MTDPIDPLVRALDEGGTGRPVVIVHGGMSDESPWLRVAQVLAARSRVVLLRRRLYRLELPVDLDTAMADQAAEVLDVAAGVGEPCVVVGHSSGAVVALEALVAADPGTFAGSVLYEPPSPLPGLPLGRPGTLADARSALAEGRVGRSLQIFLQQAVRVSPLVGFVAPLLARVPEVRRYVARQIDDLDTILRLGDRSAAYATVSVPTWLLTGVRSPEHLGARCELLRDVVPDAELVRLPGTGHGANQSHPRQLAELIADLADRC